MMIKNKYRLEEYIITEYERALFTWETHIGLGSQRSGDCFIFGNILVIKPWNREEAGYLKLEFHEHLMRLQVWNKTSYYCMSSVLRDVRTGKNLSDRFYRQEESGKKISKLSREIFETGTFCLGKYKITVEANNNILWQTYKGMNKIITGRCIAESGILFIGAEEKDFDESQSKKQWFARLKLLPKWDQTSVWSYQKVLRICEQEKMTEKSDLFIREDVADNTALLKREGNSYKNANFEFHLPQKILHSTEWKKWWKYLSLLFTVLLIVGVGILRCLIKNTENFFNKLKQYLKKHSS